MASTFPTESASSELLACILDGDPWQDYLLRRALTEDEGRLLFSVVIERLGDLFEPHLCDVYARLFTRVIELLRPEMKAADLLNRYERVRRIRKCEKQHVRSVFVLSRVTLGADVAVTGVLLDVLKRRFPDAEIHFVGSRRNWELFAGDERILHLDFPYPRSGTLTDRLSRWKHFDSPDSIVVDPDSRLTQLGLLPVCPEEDYFFFESRSYGGDGDDPLPVLTARWASEVFDESGTTWIAPERVPMRCDVAVSLGVGGRNEKRIEGSFESDLLESLLRRGLSVVVDKGSGTEETERVEQLARQIPGVQTFGGSFADFASMISQSKLYVGYDSAGQHMAAAAKVPLVTVFAGFPSERMFHRWKPWGAGPCEIVKVFNRQPAEVLRRTNAALDRSLQTNE